MKVRPVGAELFHAEKQADRQTDRHDEADSHFSKFWERALTNKYKRTQWRTIHLMDKQELKWETLLPAYL
jgi:hypothetical protein